MPTLIYYKSTKALNYNQMDTLINRSNKALRHNYQSIRETGQPKASNISRKIRINGLPLSALETASLDRNRKKDFTSLEISFFINSSPKYNLNVITYSKLIPI